MEENCWKPKHCLILFIVFLLFCSPSVNELTVFHLHGFILNIAINLNIFLCCFFIFYPFLSVLLLSLPVFLPFMLHFLPSLLLFSLPLLVSVCSSIPSLLLYFFPLFVLSSSPFLSLPPSLPCVLRVRQFIEMVNGTDSEVRCLGGRSPKSQDSYPGSPRPFSSPSHKASSSQPYLPGTVQLCSAYSHLEIRTCLASTLCFTSSHNFP